MILRRLWGVLPLKAREDDMVKSIRSVMGYTTAGAVAYWLTCTIDAMDKHMSELQAQRQAAGGLDCVRCRGAGHVVDGYRQWVTCGLCKGTGTRTTILPDER